MKARTSIIVLICSVAIAAFGRGETVKEVHVLRLPEVQAEEVKEVKEYDSLEMLARCVEAEAGNQGLLGKRLVVDVILNRVDSEQFPDTVEGVISQRGQFAVYPNAMDRVTVSDETREAIRLEIESKTDDRILFFAAHNYVSCCTPAYQHGDHYFGY